MLCGRQGLGEPHLPKDALQINQDKPIYIFGAGRFGRDLAGAFVKNGYKVFFISGGSSLEMKQTLENLGATMVYLESKSKLLVFNKLKNEYQNN